MQNYQNLKVDLSNCDREPIHIIGRIQPHGFLLILNQQTLTVEQASENIHQFLDADATSLIGKKLEQLTLVDEYDALLLQVNKAGKQDAHLLQLQGKKFFGFLHVSQGSLIIECEPFERTTSDNAVVELTSFYAGFQANLETANTLKQQSEQVVNFVQELLDYDRVMLYRFDENWNGEVIAEKIKPGVHSYLYHHFPSTDIPAQARALLEIKPVRQIADVKAQAVNITPYLNPATGVPSNIIESELRNPSEIHLEYLVNMDVLATLSVSVLVKGKLWGIIACQNHSPVFINYWKRQLCRNVAHAFANAVIGTQELRDAHALEQKRQQEELLIKQVRQCGSLGEGLFGQTLNLLHVTEASGAALFLDGKLYTTGVTPTQKQLNALLNWVSESDLGRVYNTRQLSTVYPEAKAFTQQASGLLVLEISQFKKEYILYFKPEIQETRIWAGNPEKPVASDNKRIHPRKSFSKWAEIVKGKSLPWSLIELEITQYLLKDLVSVILQNQAEALEELNTELNKTTQALGSKNKRLEEFAHIISHNLRSPLSNMQGLCNMYNSDPENTNGAEVMQMMETMIRNMSETIDDVNLILRREFEPEMERQQVDLRDIIEREQQSLQTVILQTNAHFQTDLAVTALYTSKVYIESIVHNLISNALKYRSPDREPEVSIKSWKEGEQVCISVTDNGLGMNLDRVGKRLYSMYATFHNNKEAKGLGLYLTRMQTEVLGGTIVVESTPGVGTTFKICLPAAVK